MTPLYLFYYMLYNVYFIN